MECLRCHTPIPDNSRFCLSCGADVSDPSGGGATTAAMDDAASEQLLRLVRQEVGSEFDVDRELGRGGMAIVYLATEIHLGRQVAIKVLPPELTFGPGAIERFKREARTAATLDHPHIIPIYRIAPGGKLFWYAMKFLEGESLGDLLKAKGRLSLDETIAILEQVAPALDYAHRRHVIHRDIKPANIMLDETLRVTVTDFGIAKQLAAGSFTASGSVIGTPYYMSPEQCTGSKTLTGAADQYSVGVMAYQMLSGQVPFEGDSAIDILTKHCMQPPPPLDVLRPGLPPHVYRAVDRALGKKPEERFATVTEYVDAMQHAGPEPVVARTAPSTLSRISTVILKRPEGRRQVRPLFAASLLVVAAAGGWLWLGRGSDSGSPEVSPVASRDTPALTSAAPEETTQVSSLPEDIVQVPPAAQPMREPRTTVPAERGAQGDDQPSGPPVALPAPRFGVLVVRTIGAWGRIHVDDAFRREGSSYRDSLPAGRHAIRVERTGYATVDTTVTLPAGETLVVQVQMREVQR